jgi:DNA-binding winged helix-turn-helix (wHTH) protein
MDAPIKTVVANAANEGIPVAAIARIVSHPFGDVMEVLQDAKDVGTIVEIPRSDWPPGTKIAERGPCLPADADLQFHCHKVFKLTTLEASFLVVLLKHSHATKARLHHIVEQQRMARASQPDESTDQKMVDVMICKLRKKLKKVDPALVIETIWGGGYHIEAPVKPLFLKHLSGEPHVQESPDTAGSRAVPEPSATTH